MHFVWKQWSDSLFAPHVLLQTVLRVLKLWLQFWPNLVSNWKKLSEVNSSLFIQPKITVWESVTVHFTLMAIWQELVEFVFSRVQHGENAKSTVLQHSINRHITQRRQCSTHYKTYSQWGKVRKLQEDSSSTEANEKTHPRIKHVTNHPSLLRKGVCVPVTSSRSEIILQVGAKTGLCSLRMFQDVPTNLLTKNITLDSLNLKDRSIIHLLIMNF